MNGIKTLYELYDSKSSTFIENLLNQRVIIDDNMPGSFFSVKKNDSGWSYYKKSGIITLIDRTVSKFYEMAINHFENISHDKRNNIPENLIFIFKYTNKIEHSDQIISKQILKLTHIQDVNTKQTINDIETLSYWAEYLFVDKPPIIFDGILNDDQKSAILNFIYTNQDELSKRFKSESFTEYIISTLNPNYKTNGIDSIVFRFCDENGDTVMAKFIDPLFFDLSNSNKPESNKTSDMVHLIIIQLINYIESYTVKELTSVVDSELSYERNYINVMNKIFIDYIDNNYSDLIDICIDTPTYILSPNFDINEPFIENDKIIELININPNFREIYRLLINFFRKKRRKGYGILNDEIIKMFNLLIDKLQKVIIGKNIYEKYTPCFSEYNGLISEEFNFNHMRSAGIQTKYGSHIKRKPVNIIVDYFQPINNSHIATAETLMNKNKLQTLLILIDNRDPSKIKPFSTEVSENLIKKYLSDNNQTICSYITIHKNNIDSILKQICTTYIPVLWASNKSKIDEYTIQMDYARKRNTKYNISKRFKLIISPELNTNRVIDYIETGNYNEFIKYTPKSIHSEFFNLKKEIESLNK